MNTRRVPGVTRNSGWQLVDAEIIKARALTRDETMANKVEPEQTVKRGNVGRANR